MRDRNMEALALLNWLRVKLEESLPGNCGYSFGLNQPEHNQMLEEVGSAAMRILLTGGVNRTNSLPALLRRQDRGSP